MTRVALAILAAALFAGNAAGLQNPLRDRLLRNERAEEMTGWFQRADTGEFFLFDRSGEVAFLRDRDSQNAEILVLYSSGAPGGGTSFTTDTGREVVRLTPLGGTTYFPIDAPNGVIADFASPAGTLAPPPRSPGEVHSQAERLAEDVTFSLNRTISIEYSPAPRSGLGLQYDTLRVISAAMLSLQTDRRRLRDLNTIRLEIGSRPAAYREGASLVVVFAPALGYAGRPSSDFIADVLFASAG